MNRLGIIEEIRKRKDITILQIMATWGCSRRTANEYLGAAQTDPIKIEKEDLTDKTHEEMSDIEKAKRNL